MIPAHWLIDARTGRSHPVRLDSHSSSLSAVAAEGRNQSGVEPLQPESSTQTGLISKRSTTIIASTVCLFVRGMRSGAFLALPSVPAQMLSMATPKPRSRNYPGAPTGDL